MRVHVRQRDKSRDEKGNRGSRGRDAAARAAVAAFVSELVQGLHLHEEEEEDEEAPLLRQMERLYKGRRITAAPGHIVAIHLVAFHVGEKSANR